MTNQRPTNAHLARIPRRFPSVHSVDDAVMLRSEFGESARLEDQLQLDDEANSEIADRYTTGSSARHRVAVGDLPTSSVSAPQLVLQ